jgi:hypothetical protein
MDQTEQDEQVGFMRTKYLSVIPPSDPDFPALFGRRNDTDTINGMAKSSMWLRRAHSLGQSQQHMEMIAYALMVNSLSLYLAQLRGPPDLPAA